MNTFKITLTASFLIVLVGCNEGKTPSNQETVPPTVSSSTPDAANSSNRTAATPLANPKTPQAVNSSPAKSQNAAFPPLEKPSKNQLISPEGIGPAKVGMKFGELKKALAGKAEFKVKSPFIVDFDAIAVTQAGKEQLYILYQAGVPLNDSDVIEALVTNNPNYRTAQGVGPGTPIEQAETVYGKASLSYNTLNESREYVKFANPPSKDISFRTQAPQGQPLAGIYPSSKAESKETKNYQKGAVIGIVEVYCRQNCPLPSP